MTRNTIIKILLEYRSNYRENGTSLSDACKSVLGKENILDEFLIMKGIIDTETEVLLLKEIDEDRNKLKSLSWIKYQDISNKHFDSFNGRFSRGYEVYLRNNIGELLKNKI